MCVGVCVCVCTVNSDFKHVVDYGFDLKLVYI